MHHNFRFDSHDIEYQHLYPPLPYVYAPDHRAPKLASLCPSTECDARIIVTDIKITQEFPHKNSNALRTTVTYTRAGIKQKFHVNFLIFFVKCDESSA